MVIECPDCKFSGNVSDDKIPEGGISATCPKCKANFKVQRGKEPPESLADESKCYCPKCGASQPISEACIKCGVVFSKFLDRQLQQKAQKQDPPKEASTTAEAPLETAPRTRLFRLSPSLGKTSKPLRQENQRSKKDYSTLWKFVLGFFIVGMIGNVITHTTSDATRSSSPPPTPPINDSHPKKINTKELDQACAQAISSNLKAPSTAKFTKEGHAFSNEGGKDLYLTRIIVDAQNSYGALIRDKYTCKIEVNSGRIVDLYSDSETKEMDNKLRELQDDIKRRNGSQ